MTMTVGEKNLQIATFVNYLEAQHDKKAGPKVDSPNEENDENEEPLIDKAEEKLRVDRASTAHEISLFNSCNR
ncbi:hypothetical protein COP2_044648 [Malus domestica]